MSERTIILITSVHPGEGSMGSVYIRDCIDALASNHVVLRVEQPYLIGRIAALGDVAARFVWGAFRLIPGMHEFRIKLFRLFRMRSYLRSILFDIAEYPNPIFWVTSSSPEIIFIAEQLASAGHDIRLMVLDAPGYLISNLRLSRRFAAEIEFSFRQVVKASRRIAVVSEPMRDIVCESFHPETLIIRHGSGTVVSDRQQSDASAPFRIAYAGSLYCKEEWNALIGALSSMGSQCSGRKIELHFIGHYPFEGALKSDLVIMHGYRTFEETISILSTMDAGYLPYWFEPAYKLVASTSFPGKMSAYTRANLAILHHAPAYSSVGSFLNDNPYGVHCTSIEFDVIYRSLETLIGIADLPVTSAARKSAFDRYLSGPAFSKNIREFLRGNKVA